VESIANQGPCADVQKTNPARGFLVIAACLHLTTRISIVVHRCPLDTILC
jgi:hypothetical protein